MKKERIYYKNEVCEEDAIESLLCNDEELSREDITQEMIYNETQELADMYYDDLKHNLSVITFDEDLICIADLGLWSGRKSGYKELGYNARDVLSAFSGDYIKLYSDGYDLCGEDCHHDGTNYYTFRVFKPNVNRDLFLEKIYNGTVSKRDMTRYTRSILKDVDGSI